MSDIVKERPILFSAPMVRALLDGRKTQTRRVVKRPRFCPEDYVLTPDASRQPGWTWWQNPEFDRVGWGQNCPYGKPGDRLWVRECFSGPWEMGGIPPSEWSRRGPFWYWADGNIAAFDATSPKPSIHMPRWASRITLEVTDVRVERLQDISEADAIAEGLYRSLPDDDDKAWYRVHCEERDENPDWDDFNAGVWMAPGARQGWGLTKAERDHDQWGPTAQFAYRLVWESLNGRGSWQVNPWVWAVSFRRVEGASAA